MSKISHELSVSLKQALEHFHTLAPAPSFLMDALENTLLSKDAAKHHDHDDIHEDELTDRRMTEHVDETFRVIAEYIDARAGTDLDALTTKKREMERLIREFPIAFAGHPHEIEHFKEAIKGALIIADATKVISHDEILSLMHNARDI